MKKLQIAGMALSVFSLTVLSATLIRFLVGDLVIDSQNPVLLLVIMVIGSLLSFVLAFSWYVSSFIF
ncbi:MAG: hypothetical protein JXR54_09830 [Tannerellaceae bacterium]|nr:hypothetical protein [Tannerellaceae bacterium]